MRKPGLILAFILVAVLALGGLSPALAAPSAQQAPAEHRGLFGTVTALGANTITLDTAQGPVVVTADQNTKRGLFFGFNCHGFYAADQVNKQF